MKYKLLVISLIALFACKQKSSKSESLIPVGKSPGNENTDDSRLNYAPDSRSVGLGIATNREGKHLVKCLHVIVDDSLSEYVFDLKSASKLGLKGFFNHPYNVYFKVTKNLHDSTYQDSTYIVKSGSSVVTFSNIDPGVMAKSGRVMWKTATITDNSIIVFSTVSIGSSKVDFYNAINKTYNACDSVRITSSEQLFENLFVFRNNRLTNIVLADVSD